MGIKNCFWAMISLVYRDYWNYQLLERDLVQDFKCFDPSSILGIVSWTKCFYNYRITWADEMKLWTSFLRNIFRLKPHFET